MKQLLFILILLVATTARATNTEPTKQPYEPSHLRIAIVDNFKTYHGKAVYELISKNTKNVTITKFQFDGHNLKNYYQILETIKKEKFDLVNLSLGHQDYDGEEVQLIRDILNQGSIIVTAAGNENQRLSIKNQVFPCMLKSENLYCVGAGKDDKAPVSNFGSGVSYFIDGSFKEKNKEHNATSFAAPRFLAVLAKLKQMPNLDQDSVLESRAKYVISNDESLRIIQFEELMSDLNYLNKKNFAVFKGPF